MGKLGPGCKVVVELLRSGMFVVTVGERVNSRSEQISREKATRLRDELTNLLAETTEVPE